MDSSAVQVIGTTSDSSRTRDSMSKAIWDRLASAIDHAAHLQPEHEPIRVFIHHNPLLAFEHMAFFAAVENAASRFKCRPYLAEDQYRGELARGRILESDLEEVLSEELGPKADENVILGRARRELRRAMLLYPIRHGPTRELLGFVAETDALRKVRPDVSAVVRRRLLVETRRWVLRDLCVLHEMDAPTCKLQNQFQRTVLSTLGNLLERFGKATIESWSEAT